MKWKTDLRQRHVNSSSILMLAYNMEAILHMHDRRLTKEIMIS